MAKKSLFYQKIGPLLLLSLNHVGSSWKLQRWARSKVALELWFKGLMQIKSDRVANASWKSPENRFTTALHSKMTSSHLFTLQCNDIKGYNTVPMHTRTDKSKAEQLIWQSLAHSCQFLCFMAEILFNCCFDSGVMMWPLFDPQLRLKQPRHFFSHILNVKINAC